MKKFLTAKLTAAFVFGMSATVFAANPFSDVPAGHWAYDSVAKLAAEGVIEGYGDGTYRGNRNITRYEMAQMIARALAKKPAANNVSLASRAELAKLAAEFHAELETLGVRVERLEKHGDKVRWLGKVEFNLERERTDKNNTGHKDKENSSGYTVYLVTEAEINDNWTANAELQADGDLKEDSTTNVRLNNIFAEGDYGKFAAGLGRLPLYTNEGGLVFDTDFSGAILLFGDEFYLALGAGRLENDGVGGGVKGEFDSENDTADVVGVNIQYDPDDSKGLYGGAGFYYLKDDDLKTYNYSNDGKTDKANIWTANLGYGFTDKLGIFGSYAQNTKADREKSSWQAQLEYGNYDEDNGRLDRGDWSVWAGYRRYGTNVSFQPTDDDTIRGTRGWVVGASYAPFRNIGLTARYFKGKFITDRGDAEKVFGQINFFF